MVSTLSILSMVFTLLICFLLPLGLAIYFFKKERIYIGAIFIGALIFTVSQLMTRIPLLQWLGSQEWFMQMSTNTLFLTLFLALTAALFEETGRLLGFRFLLKNRLEWKNGIAFGIGHGGFEAIVIVGLANINNIVFSFLINSGQSDKLAAGLPPETYTYVFDQLTNNSPALFLIGGLERIMTIVIHIALSLVVLYGVMNRKYIYWLYAVLLHTLLNSPVILMENYGIWVVEAILFVMFIAALVFIVKSRKWFTDGTF